MANTPTDVPSFMRTSVHIERCDAGHATAWNAYVQSAGTFYHRYEWRAINEQCFGHRSCYLAAMRDGRVVGVFPLVQVKSRLFGNIACSMPFVNFGGPCAEDDTVERELLATAEAVVAEWKSEYLEIRSLRPLGDRYPSSEHKVSMTVELNVDAEALWNAYKTGHRQDIRRGQKKGFAATFGGRELVDEFFDVLSENWRDMGTPIFARSYLHAIVEAFGKDVRVCLIRDAAGTPAAGAFYGHHGDTVEGMWLGSRAAYRREYVGYVLYWEILRDACERGFRLFHLGRSSVESGGETFKKKWNATATQLYWHYFLRTRSDIPQLNVNNRKYRLAIAAWTRLPVGVAEQIGPMIARSIP